MGGEVAKCRKVRANLSRDANQEKPLERGVGSIVYDLTAGETGVTIKHLLRLGITYRQR